MTEQNRNLILNDNLELSKNTVGFYTNNFPEIPDAISELSHSKCNFSNDYEIISLEFLMEISLQIQLGKLFFTVRTLEFLSGNSVVISRVVKLAKDFTMNNSPQEKSVIKFTDENTSIIIEKQKTTHHIKCNLIDVKFGKCEVDLTLVDGKTKDCLSVDSFSLPTEFSVNFHKFGMVTSGFAKFGSLFFNFSTTKNIGNFNFERSLLPKKIMQIKSWGSGFDEKNTFGFAILLDQFSTHSNRILFNNIWTEIEKVSIEFDEIDLMKKWKISNSKLQLDMIPFSIDKFERKIFFSKVSTTRVYGYFSGKFIFDKDRTENVANIISFIDIIVNH